MSRKFLILSIALTLCISAAWAKPSSVSELDSEDSFDGLELMAAPRTDLSDIASAIFTVKDSIRDVIVECGIQIFKYVVKCLWNLKINLLKKLAAFTLSDVLGTILDGAVGLMADASGASSGASSASEPVSYSYEYESPYGSLAPLFRQLRSASSS